MKNVEKIDCQITDKNFFDLIRKNEVAAYRLSVLLGSNSPTHIIDREYDTYESAVLEIGNIKKQLNKNDKLVSFGANTFHREQFVAMSIERVEEERDLAAKKATLFSTTNLFLFSVAMFIIVVAIYVAINQ